MKNEDKKPEIPDAVYMKIDRRFKGQTKLKIPMLNKLTTKIDVTPQGAVDKVLVIEADNHIDNIKKSYGCVTDEVKELHTKYFEELLKRESAAVNIFGDTEPVEPKEKTPEEIEVEKEYINKMCRLEKYMEDNNTTIDDLKGYFDFCKDCEE